MPALLLWHGRVETGPFDTSQSLGVHFGSESAAAERLEQTDPNGAIRSHPYLVTIDQPLVLRDIGIWSFGAVVSELRRTGNSTAIQCDAFYAAFNLSDAAGWIALKTALRANGFDGMSYQNLIEDFGSISWIAFDVHQFEEVREGEFEIPRDC